VGVGLYAFTTGCAPSVRTVLVRHFSQGKSLTRCGKSM